MINNFEFESKTIIVRKKNITILNPNKCDFLTSYDKYIKIDTSLAKSQQNTSFFKYIATISKKQISQINRSIVLNHDVMMFINVK